MTPDAQAAICSNVALNQQRPWPPLRILAIFFHPTALVTALGGAEKRFVETLKAFCRESDLEVTVLESAPNLLEKAEITCTKHLLPLIFHGKGWLGTYLEWSFWTIKSSLRSFSLVRQVNPNVILIPNSTLPNLVSGYIAGRVFQRPICVIVHHIDMFPAKGAAENRSVYSGYRIIDYSRVVSLAKTVAFYLTLPILKRVKAIIVVSAFTAKVLRKSGVSTASIFVSGNAVDLSLIDKTKPCAEERRFDGVFVGRIAKEKGVFDLLKAWEQVVKVRRNAKLLVIGSGLELSVLKEKIAVLGLEKNVMTRGRCGENELYGLLKSSRCFVFPSLLEGWGIAVAEALACGLPVVAYDIPALREVFGNCSSVFLVPVKDVDSLTSSILKIINATEREQSELECCSRLYSRQFSWEKVARKDLQVLRNLGECF